jgi:DNA-binding transcriptional ArsR family regulator
VNARKATSVAGVVAVALVAAAISYDHQNHLAATHGQPPILAAIWPLCTDGMIASCAAVVATDRTGGYRPRTWAVSGFWLGVAVSILTNWLATSGGLVAHGVSAFPALAFLITIEALSSRPRARKSTTPAPPVEKVARDPEPKKPAPEAAPLTVKTLPVSPKPAPAVTVTKRVPAAAKRQSSNAEKVARAVVKTPDATAVELARRLKLSESTVRRHLPATVTVTNPESEHVNGHSFEMEGATS